MKITVKAILIYLILSVTVSCKENTDKKNQFQFENEDIIDKILIQFYPTFQDNSLMLLDFSTKQLNFQRIGLKKYFHSIPPKEIVLKYAPKSINFQIDSLSYSYLRDSISFNKEDFVDKERAYNDGISHTILYIFKSGRIEDVDLINRMTDNEHKLIVKLIDLNITHSTDSLTSKYLEDLRRYHYRNISDE
jgi:hypothetical protein